METPTLPQTWTLRLPRDRALALGGRPRVMGILNLTPDSFSDGGLWLEPGMLESLAQEPLEAKTALLLDVRARRTGTILRLSPVLLCPHCHLALLGGTLYEVTSHAVHSCPNCAVHFIGQHVLEEMATGRPK